MLPAIAIIISAYTVTRLLEMATTKTTNIAVRVIAVLAMIVTVFALFGVMASASSVPAGLR
jgi:hypothetical protein